jgi:hypothetical protein
MQYYIVEKLASRKTWNTMKYNEKTFYPIGGKAAVSGIYILYFR